MTLKLINLLEDKVDTLFCIKLDIPIYDKGIGKEIVLVLEIGPYLNLHEALNIMMDKLEFILKLNNVPTNWLIPHQHIQATICEYGYIDNLLEDISYPVIEHIETNKFIT